MTRDIDSYLKELQAAMVAAGADPALVQDALFDAEEYLRAEMTEAGDFSAVTEAYGSPDEVAVAYLGMSPAGGAEGGLGAEAAQTVAKVEAQPPPTTPPQEPLAEPIPQQAPAPQEAAQQLYSTVVPNGQQQNAQYAPSQGGPQYEHMPPYGPPPGVQAGMAAAATGGRKPSVWGQIFGVYADPAVYKAMVYMILSLATGITYFTIVVTGISTAGGMLVMIIGLPLFLLVLGIVRAMALFEGRIVEGLLGTRMPRRERSAPPEANVFERVWFWIKDGRTWASMAYMILMLPLGIVYFTVTITGLAAGVGLVTAIAWGWFGDANFMYEGVIYHWWFPAWAIPIAVVGGVIVLTGTLHLIQLMGRGHAIFAKNMLVRLAK